MGTYNQIKEVDTIIIQENFRQFLLKNKLGERCCIFYPSISETPDITGCVECGNEWITYQTNERGKVCDILKFDDIFSAFNNMLERFGLEFDLTSYMYIDTIALLYSAKEHLEFKIEQYEMNEKYRRWFEYKLNIIDSFLQFYIEKQNNKKLSKQIN